MARDKKRICLALSNVNAEDAIMKVVNEKFSSSYEIVENVRSKEALISAINKEKFDCIILREDLTGNIDLIELFKQIRMGNNDLQIIFFMKSRENGDPFYIEMFLFNIYDFIVLPDIKLDDIFNFLAHPRQFSDVLRFLPARAERIRNLIIEANTNLKTPPKINEDGDVDEVFTVHVKDNKAVQKEVPQTASEYYAQNKPKSAPVVNSETPTISNPTPKITHETIPQVTQNITPITQEEDKRDIIETLKPEVKLELPKKEENVINKPLTIENSSDVEEDDA